MNEATTTPARFRVLMVCMGNICRSPTAEGVLRARLAAAGLADRVEVDSAGTHDYHVGAPPDHRSQEHAARRGIDLSKLRGRQVCAGDFERFDLLLAMDHDNLELLEEACPGPHLRHKLGLFMRFGAESGSAVVPDPYYGGAAGFERVLDLVEVASDGLVKHLSQTLSRR
jgi:protein-tyrosine phosphatase